MKTKIKTLTAAGLLLASSAAIANEGTFGFSYLHIDDGDITLGAFTSTVGYVFPINDGFSIIPEFRAGIGINDDRFEGLNFELKSLIGANLRFQFNVSDAAYLFLSPSYNRYKIKGSMPIGDATLSASATDDGFGFGGGIGYQVSDGFALEAGYERVDGINVVMVGSRIRF